MLGRHVGRGAAGGPVHAQGLAALGGAHRRRGGGGLEAPGPGEAEVRDLGHAVGRDHDVVRLHVEVHEALFVGVVQTPGELDAHVEHRVQGRDLRGPDPLVQAPAVDELREEHGNALQSPDVEAGDDVRVQAQVHPGLGLALEEGGAALDVEEGRPRDFGGKGQVPSAVPHLVDPPHPALSQHALHLVEVEEDVALFPLGEPLRSPAPARARTGHGGGIRGLEARGECLRRFGNGGRGCGRLDQERARATGATNVASDEGGGRLVRTGPAARADDADHRGHQPKASRRASRSSAAVG